ncbi:MAG: gamma-glutamyltransferase [Gemmatimonadales bacterium]|nr:gamma-glutamyltransferase [Gemmatimonadales bacterium]
MHSPLRAAWCIAAVLLTQPSPSLLAQGTTVLPATWKHTGKARVLEAPSAMVTSGSPLASDVGRDIMKAGGNAIDAAVAVGFALAVTHPEAGNVGGGGFMVIRLANGTAATIDYRETAPAAATRDMYLDDKGEPTERSIYGHLAAGVPGAVAGMLEAHRRYGKLPLKRLLAPAIALARDGFIIDDYRSRSIRGHVERLAQYETSASQFLINGKEPAPGTLWKQPALAKTLQAIASRGRDGFYRGWVADAIVAEMQRGGGIITKADLAGYQAKWRTPITVNYRGWTILSMPPASSGGATLAMMLNMLEGYGPLPPFGSVALLHREAEVMRLAFTERNARLGDPDFEQIPLAEMVSKEHAAKLRARGNLAVHTPTPTFDPALREGSNTTHYSVVDAAGNAVSTTTTLNNSYGSHVTVAGAGFLLNDEMDDFATAPGKPNMYGLVQGEVNAIKPGKRMLSAMTPSLVLDPTGQLRLVVGTPGGPTIITQVYHVISNVIDHGMSLPAAVEAPRMHHQGLPDRMRLEGPGGFAPAVVAWLKAIGHDIQNSGGMGDVQAIARVRGGWQGVSDPRYGGGPSGY